MRLRADPEGYMYWEPGLPEEDDLPPEEGEEPAERPVEKAARGTDGHAAVGELAHGRRMDPSALEVYLSRVGV